MSYVAAPVLMQIRLTPGQQLAYSSASINWSRPGRVEVATDGAETLEAVRKTEPDLLILDMEMPRGDGLEVLEEPRAEPATVDQPVIVLSNKTLSEGEERRLVKLGVIDFLAKWKVDPRVLVGWIRGWAASHVRRYSPREKRR